MSDTRELATELGIDPDTVLKVRRRADGAVVVLFRTGTEIAFLPETVTAVAVEAPASPATVTVVAAEARPAGDPPLGNASRARWLEYRQAEGRTDVDLEGLSRDELRDLGDPE